MLRSIAVGQFSSLRRRSQLSQPRRWFSSLPLAGIRVLDLSRVLAAPLCSQVLGDLGAEVIKVEHPNGGDETRQWGPPFTRYGAESAYFLCANRNKKSVTIDIKTDAGRSLLRQLAKHSDVLIENMLPSKMDAIGLGYERLTASDVNPDLIYCALTGYASDSQWSARGGYDVVIQGVGGLMSITGPQSAALKPEATASHCDSDSHSSVPCKTGVALIDVITGLYLHGAILAALRKRDIKRNEKMSAELSGVKSEEWLKCGEKLEVSLMDSQLASLINIASNYLVSGTGYEPQQWGTAHESIVPYQAFETKDGRYFLVGATNDVHFVRLCQLLSASIAATASDSKESVVIGDNTSECAVLAMTSDPRFATNSDRVLNRDLCVGTLAARFKEKTREEWMDVFDKSAETLVYGPLNTVPEILESDYVSQQKSILEIEGHPTISPEPVRVIKYPVKFSDSSVGCNPTPPPVLGQHTAEVLRDVCGLHQSDIDSLVENGVVSVFSKH